MNRTARAGSLGAIVLWSLFATLTPILSTLALAPAGAIADGAWMRLAPALLLVIAGVSLSH